MQGIVIEHVSVRQRGIRIDTRIERTVEDAVRRVARCHPGVPTHSRLDGPAGPPNLAAIMVGAPPFESLAPDEVWQTVWLYRVHAPANQRFSA